MEKRQHGLIGKTGVYALIINNIIRYVGSTGYSFESRKSNHLALLRQGKHTTKKLQAAYDKYGEDLMEFKVLEYCKKSDTFEKEKYWKEIYQDTVFNKNEVKNEHKHLRRGKEAANHKEKYKEIFKGTENTNCQTDLNMIITIKRMIAAGYSNIDIAKETGKTSGYVSLIRTGKRWKDIDVEDNYMFTVEDFQHEGISLRDS